MANFNYSQLLARLASAIAIPLILGWLILHGYQAKLYEPAFAIALLVLLLIAIYISSIWGNAVFLNRVDGDRQAVQQQLQQQAELLELAYEAIFARDINNVITYWNRGAEQTYGWTRTEAKGKVSHDLLQTQFSPDCDDIDTLLLQHEYWEGELTHTCKEGGQIVVESRQVLIRDSQGVPVGFLEVNRDVTERKRAEAALQESNARFRLLVNSIEDVFWMSDPKKEQLIYVSPTYEKIWGRSCESLKADFREWINAIHPDERERVQEIFFKSVMQGKYDVEYRVVRPDGSIRWVRDRGYPVKNENAIVQYVSGVAQDITARKAAEVALRQSQETIRRQLAELDAIYQTAPIGLAILDTDLRFVRINQRLAEINGISIEEHIGRTVREIVPDLADEAEPLFHRLLETGEPLLNLEISGETAAQPGVHRTWLENWFPFKDENGRIVGINVVVQEITERKRAEADLKESEERFRRAILNAPFPIIIHAEDGEVVQISQAWTEITGYTHDEIPTIAAWTEKAYGEAKDAVKAGIDRLYELDGKLKEGEFFITTKHGEKRTWDFSSAPLGRLADGRRLVVSIAADVSDRKQAEDAMRQSEARLRLFVESDVIGILYGDIYGGISYANDAFLNIIGYDRTDLSAGRISWADITPSEYVPLDAQRIAEAQARGTCTPYEKEYIRKDGTRVFVMVGYALLGENREQSIAFILDISDRKQAEAELRESEQRFRYLTNAAPMMVWMSGTDKLCTYFNKSWLAFTGREMEQELGNGWLEGVHSDDLQCCLDTYGRAFDARDDFQMEYRLKRFDGEYRWVLDIGAPRFTPEGNFLGYIGSCVDITERKSAESEIAKLNQSLNRQIQKLETLVEVIPIGIGIAEDPECQKIRVNPSFAKQLGISPDINASLSAIEGERPTGFKVYRDGREMSVEELPMQYAAAHGVEIRDLEVDVVREDGKTVKLLEYAAPLFDEQGNTIGSVGAFIDITGRKHLEQKLHKQAEILRKLNETLEERVKQRTAQLEAANKELESFSYSVSHDLRAPLRHITGFVDLLQKRIKSTTTLDETSQRYLNIIVETTQLAGKLIDDLLSFSRMGRTEMRSTSIDMNLLVQEVLRDLELETKKRQITWQIETLPSVHGDPSMLRLVLRNLVENALKYTKLNPQTEIAIGSQISSQEVVFFVRDNGIGFDMQYVHKLFGVFQRLHSDPNFQGTGVGLANVQRIIHRHGGRVWAEGAVGKGATFYFSLPLDLGVRGGE